MAESSWRPGYPMKYDSTRTAISEQSGKLRKSINEIKALSSLISICMHCKKIRDNQGGWAPLEVYIESHTGAKFSHGLCPECARNVYGIKRTPKYRR